MNANFSTQQEQQLDSSMNNHHGGGKSKSNATSNQNSATSSKNSATSSRNSATGRTNNRQRKPRVHNPGEKRSVFQFLRWKWHDKIKTAARHKDHDTLLKLTDDLIHLHSQRQHALIQQARLRKDPGSQHQGAHHTPAAYGNAASTSTASAHQQEHVPHALPKPLPNSNVLCFVIEAMARQLSPVDATAMAAKLRGLGQPFPHQATAVYLEALAFRHLRLGARCHTTARHRRASPHQSQNAVQQPGVQEPAGACTTTGFFSHADDDKTSSSAAASTNGTSRPTTTLEQHTTPHGEQQKQQQQQQQHQQQQQQQPRLPELDATDIVHHTLRFRRAVNGRLDRLLVDDVGRRLKRRAPPAVTRDVLELLMRQIMRGGASFSRRALDTYVVAVREAGDVMEAYTALQLAEQNRSRLNHRQFSLLLQLASTCRRDDIVEELFSEMARCGVEPRVWAWSERMRCYALKGEVDRVEATIEEMKRLRLPLLPSVFHRFIEAHARAGDLVGAEQVYKIFQRTGSKTTPALLIPLLQAYLAGSHAMGALSTLIRMQEAGLFCRESDVAAVRALFKEQGNLAGRMRTDVLLSTLKGANQLQAD